MLLTFKIALSSLALQIILLALTIPIATCHMLWAIIVFCLLAAPLTSLLALVGMFRSFLLDKSHRLFRLLISLLILAACVAIFIFTGNLAVDSGHAGC